jgi:predicted PurR-regulated permease PerM
MLAPYLLDLFFGGLLAMLGDGVRRRMSGRGWPDPLAAFATTVLMAFLLVAPVAGFTALAAREGLEAGRSLAGNGRISKSDVAEAIEGSRQLRRALGDPALIKERLQEGFRRAERAAAGLALRATRAVPEFLLHLALALVSCHFFLLDGERLARRLLALSALEPGVQRALIRAMRDTAVSSVVAGLAAATVQGGLMTAGYLLLGIPRPFLAGTSTFFFSWIPVIGSAPASLAGILYLWFEGSTAKVVLMCALAASTALVDNLVRPYVLKGRDALHPLLGLVAVIGGLDLFGVLGLFLGPVLVSSLVALLALWPEQAERGGVALESASGRSA